jgi:hypothetical protein
MYIGMYVQNRFALLEKYLPVGANFEASKTTTMHTTEEIFYNIITKSPSVVAVDVAVAVVAVVVVVANPFRINCSVIRNSESYRCGILFYARSETPLSE